MILAPRASADISCNDTYCNSNYSFNATLGVPVSFPQFDPTLGTLVDVQLSANGWFTTDVRGTSYDFFGGFNSVFRGGVSTGDVGIALAGIWRACLNGDLNNCVYYGDPLDPYGPLPTSSVFFDYSNDSPGLTTLTFLSRFGFYFDPSLSGGGNQNYIGTGSLTFTGTGDGTAYPQLAVNEPGPYQFDVSYEYTPAANPAPEPALSLLTGAAFGALAALRWRRRKGRRPVAAASLP